MASRIFVPSAEILLPPPSIPNSMASHDGKIVEKARTTTSAGRMAGPLQLGEEEAFDPEWFRQGLQGLMDRPDDTNQKVANVVNR